MQHSSRAEADWDRRECLERLAWASAALLVTSACRSGNQQPGSAPTTDTRAGQPKPPRLLFPAGGIGAGQVLLGLDGRLEHFDASSGPSLAPRSLNVEVPPEQGWAVRFQGARAELGTRRLDAELWSGFEAHYEPHSWCARFEAPELPVCVSLRVLPPLVPGELAWACLPAVILNFEFENRSQDVLELELLGWIEAPLTPGGSAASQALQLSAAGACAAYFERRAETPEAADERCGALGLIAFDPNARAELEPEHSGLLRGTHGRAPRLVQVRIALRLEPGERAQRQTAISWHFPYVAGGRLYTLQCPDHPALVGLLARQLPELLAGLAAWRSAWEGTSLSPELVQCISAPTALLSTKLVQLTGNGAPLLRSLARGAEGDSELAWLNASSAAWLFPELERFSREANELGQAVLGGPSVQAASGSKQVRAAAVLRFLRDHRLSSDDSFLQLHYGAMQYVLQQLLLEDGGPSKVPDGSLEAQDGPLATQLLYLGALEAAQLLAERMGQRERAKELGRLLASGSASLEQRFAAGALRPDLGLSQAAGTALDRLIESSPLPAALLAAELDLAGGAPEGLLLEQAAALQQAFAAAAFHVPWPRAYPVTLLLAAQLLRQDAPEAALALLQSPRLCFDARSQTVDRRQRLDADSFCFGRHTAAGVDAPSDFDARALASWSVLLAAAGLQYDGPAGSLEFAPHLTPADFAAPFTVAQGFGRLYQKRSAGTQENRVELLHGSLALAELGLEAPLASAGAWQVELLHGTTPVQHRLLIEGRRLRLVLREPLLLEASGAALVARIQA